MFFFDLEPLEICNKEDNSPQPDLFAVDFLAPSDGVDAAGNNYSAGDSLVLLSNGNAYCMEKPSGGGVGGDDTFAVIETATAEGDDYYGVSYTTGDDLLKLPNGELICIRRTTISCIAGEGGCITYTDKQGVTRAFHQNLVKENIGLTNSMLIHPDSTVADGTLLWTGTTLCRNVGPLKCGGRLHFHIATGYSARNDMEGFGRFSPMVSFDGGATWVDVTDGGDDEVRVNNISNAIGGVQRLSEFGHADFGQTPELTGAIDICFNLQIRQNAITAGDVFVGNARMHIDVPEMVCHVVA